MSRTCILTDSTVIYPKLDFSGSEAVQIIPFSPQDSFAPSAEDFRHTFAALGNRYHDIITILCSSHLTPAVENARQAVADLRSPLNIQILDSQTTAIGLGLLVEAAAESIKRGISTQDICNQIRSMIHEIYSIFCLPNLSHLARAGQIDPAQAIVGEMLEVLPVFNLENGQLMHMQKIRSPRHLVELFLEYILEFEQLKFLALLQGSTNFEIECHALCERLDQNNRLPRLNYYAITPELSTLLGSDVIGLVALQKTGQENK